MNENNDKLIIRIDENVKHIKEKQECILIKLEKQDMRINNLESMKDKLLGAIGIIGIFTGYIVGKIIN